MELLLGSEILPPGTEQPFDLFSLLSVNWVPMSDNYYTLIIYSIPPEEAGAESTVDRYSILPEETHQGDRVYIQFLLVNIPGNRIGEGEVLIPYQLPSPDYGTGQHYYVIVLALQGRAIPSTLSLSRHDFSLSTFAKQYRLSLVDDKVIIIDSSSRLWYLNP